MSNKSIQDYLRLLNDASEQILNLYNEENETEYRLEEVIEGFEEEYMQNGVLYILLSRYFTRINEFSSFCYFTVTSER